MTRLDLVRWLMRERRRAPLWAPVCLGLGIWLYFAAPFEPSGWVVAVALAAPVATIPMAMGRRRPLLSLAFIALALVSLGLAMATLRARIAAEPVLAGAIDATVEGQVMSISRSRTDMRRVLLEDVVIFGVARGETPARVRVTLLEGAFARDVQIGDRIAVFARIGPPGDPVEPGAFDFRRWAWFEGLGAVGFARGPAVAAVHAELEGPMRRLRNWLAQRRGDLSRAIQAAIPGENGAFASAILTGNREGVRQSATQALRDSNLAHLLAISGLHMGLLSAIVFGAVRLLLALIPRAALYWQTQKIAAAAALAAGLAYLLLSGASVATQRAFVMAAAALIAVMLDRPAISLRALAAAALAILLYRPESLTGAGFQMSFAATTALIAFYEIARRRQWFAFDGARSRWRVLARYAVGLALTSLIAGLATAPFSAISFNRIANYGLLANVTAVPVMAFWVMPMGALAAALAPLGLEQPALWLMGQGIGAILWVARVVASLPGAVRPVAAAHDAVLPLITLGGLWLALWSTRMRFLGLGALALAMATWGVAGARPELLIAPEGRLIGLMGPQGRALDRSRGGGYPATVWLARDGDGADQRAAARRPGLTHGEGRAEGSLSNGWRVALIRGRASLKTLEAACKPGVILITPGARASAPGDCLRLGPEDLRRRGAVSITPRGDGVALRNALDDARERVWGMARDR